MPSQAKKDMVRPDCYHHTERLLKVYRDVRWNLKLSMEHHQLDFEEAYGMNITDYLDELYVAGIEFKGTKLEHHANSMKRTAEMLKLIDATAFLIRNNNSEGEAFYWILYYTYFSPLKLSGVSAIIDRIQMHIPYITRDTYYRFRKRALRTFSSVLWGYTTRSEIDSLNSLT